MRARTRAGLSIAAAVCTSLAMLAGRASASYHTFQFDEIYSNPSGSVQFVVLHEIFGDDFQNLESLAPDIFAGGTKNIGNAAHDLTLTNLPSTSTANKFYLLGTAGYAAIPGAPKPDYTIPSDFFNPAGDTLQYGQGFGEPHPGPDGIVDQISFGALPTDPTQALHRVGIGGDDFSVGPAIANTFSSGGNFAVPEPSSAAVVCLAGAALFARRRSA